MESMKPYEKELFPQPGSEDYKIIRIKKSAHNFRLIYVPGEDAKKRLRSHLPYLHYLNLSLDTHRACHAFVKGRNCVTNALPHIGYTYTISMDIENFFDSIRECHVSNIINQTIINDCFVDEAPRQGLPTSPLIANIALLDSDELIIDSLEDMNIAYAYTRYADDISISFDDKKLIGKIIFIVKSILKNKGFKINEKKTRVQSTKNGRKIITGIAVDNRGLHPTRKTLKKIRAAAHQNNKNSIIGLKNWADCKLPRMGSNPAKKEEREFFNDKPVTCQYCDKPDLRWGKIGRSKIALFNREDKTIHLCRPGKNNISQKSMIQVLKNMGFEEFSPLCATWFAGLQILSPKRHNRNIAILFRKKGIDVCVHSKPLKQCDHGKLSVAGGRFLRYSYASSGKNVHEIILRHLIDEGFVTGA